MAERISMAVQIIGLSIGAALVVLDAYATRYMRRLWSASSTERHPERSWLLGRLWTLSAIVTLAIIYFIETAIVRLFLGPQLLLQTLSTLVFVLVLLQPYLIAREFRRREWLAARMGQRGNKKAA